MNIIITGSAGFIGHHLVMRLISTQNELLCIDNINDYYETDLKLNRLSKQGIYNIINEDSVIHSQSFNNLKFIKSDLSSNILNSHIIKNFKPDVIIHLAAQAGVRYSIENPATYISSNIVAFYNVLELARNQEIKHLIYASSSSVYGMNEQVPFKISDCVDHPMSLYAATKKSNEIIAHSYSHIFNIPCTGLRFFTVYGPWGRPDMALFKFTKSIIERKPIQIYNNGNLSRDFTYIDDIIEGIKSLIDKPAKPEPNWSEKNPSISSAPFRIYNLGRGQPVQLIDFVNEIENKLGIKAIREYVEMQPGDVSTTHADISESTKYFGYLPKTSISDGIDQFIKWYRTYYKV